MRNNKGFTLLETMIAMAIMMVAFSSILMVESASINTSIKARQMNVVAMLAKNMMIETEVSFEGKTFEEYKKEETGQFKEPFQDYTWKREVKEIEFPELNFSGKEEGAGGDDPNAALTDMVVKKMAEYLSDAIREVTVTISWNRGSGVQSFSLATYWVNLNTKFPQ